MSVTRSLDSHLSKLADRTTLALLTERGFEWTPVDRNACAALRFKHRAPDAPMLVGLLGGASSGKSTVFNSLLDREVSRISAHAHETLGPIAAVHRRFAEQLMTWSDADLIFPGLQGCLLDDDTVTSGRLQAVDVHRHNRDELAGAVVVDLPDVTSKMASDEGSLTRTLLPWFDVLLVVVDEERWFDATVFDETVEYSRNLGPRIWVVFNRTESADQLTPADRQRLSDHAATCHAAGLCISPFQPGTGYRPLSTRTRQQIVSWISDTDPTGRANDLRRYLQRRCAQLVRTNETRSRQFTDLCHDVDKQLQTLTAETSLTTDLLTTDERTLLGLGHRFVPLYNVFQDVRRHISRFTRRTAAEQEIDFEKRTEQLSLVLRRNLEHRFGHAAHAIDRMIMDSPYMADTDAVYTAQWTVPSFDDQEWASRIRAHIDAWKAETMKQSRRSDATVLTLGFPLLLADLLFLGGAGVTLFSAAAWVAGMFGGKGLLKLVQRSPAFSEYQTTVRAYQTFIRETLQQQTEANLAAIPRRHLPMTDPTLQAILSLSTPTAGQGR